MSGAVGRGCVAVRRAPPFHVPPTCAHAGWGTLLVGKQWPWYRHVEHDEEEEEEEDAPQSPQVRGHARLTPCFVAHNDFAAAHCGIVSLHPTLVGGGGVLACVPEPKQRVLQSAAPLLGRPLSSQLAGLPLAMCREQLSHAPEFP